MSSGASWAGRQLHFVGIGGAGMSALALVARALGAQVTGSDRSESSYTRRLREHGIEPLVGHAAANVPDGAEVVRSTAIADDNPELAAARERGLTVLHRAQLLAELVELRRCIAVTGTHGKTTTAAMVVHILAACGLEPSYVVGAQLRATGDNAGWGAGEWLVVEADESDRSLLSLRPEIAILLNAELDHHATYGSRGELRDTLREFLARAAQAVVWDRADLLALAPAGEAVPFDAPAPRLHERGSRFEWRGLDVELPVAGEHNAIDAAGALEACRLAGVPDAPAAAALASFEGVARRFEALGRSAAGAEIYDDYAHHPTEVAATLRGARTRSPRRLIAVFQPHLYSRTAALAREFGEALALADLVVVLDVYPARERAEDHPGVSGRLIAAATADAADGRPVAWLPTFDAARAFLAERLRDGDLCVVLGAGDVDRLGRALCE